MPNGNEMFARLKQACVFITSPDGSTGSGYLVAPQRIGTAEHVVRSWQEGRSYPVLVGVEEKTSCQARLLKIDKECDAAVLAFDEPLAVLPLPIAAGLAQLAAWQGYGFPALAGKQERPQGLPIDGQVKDPSTRNDIGQSAVLLYSDIIAAGNASPLHGFSGSPVLVQGALVGHLTKHIGDPDDRRRAAYGYVYACPIEAVVRLLDVVPAAKDIDPPRLETIADAIPAVQEGAYHVFVSYRSTDRDWAMSLVARLEGAGLRVFIDQRELEVGGYLAEQLDSALARSRAAVVLVSQGWLGSPWCQQEANVLVKRAVEDKGFKLVPLRLDDSRMPGLLDTRVWLDFNGSKRAEGPGMERLLNALIGRAPPSAASLEGRADAAEGRVTEAFVAEVNSAAHAAPRKVLEVIEQWRKTASSDVAPLIRAAEVLNGKAEFELALQVLEGAPDTLRVRQLRAFALRKQGGDGILKSIALLEKMRDAGELDAEGSGLLAGGYKTLWLQMRDKGYLQRAYDTYREAFERYGDAFNGINAATLALHCRDAPKRYAYAGRVRDDLLGHPADKLSYWDLATLGEACLLLERRDDARDWYAQAAGRAAGLHQDIAVMRRQARLILRELGQAPDALDNVLPVPRVLVYLGHMVDAPGRPVPRFPAAKVGAVKAAIQGRMAQYGALHGFGQASRGTDLIVLKELADRGLSATVVLPYPEEAFVGTSVGERWSERFAEVRKAAGITFSRPLSDSRPPDEQLPQALDQANKAVQRLAVEYARRLDETPVVLAVWDGKPGDGPGGTADAVALWQEEGYAVDVIDITAL